jgi:hypothetical protein
MSSKGNYHGLYPVFYNSQTPTNRRGGDASIKRGLGAVHDRHPVTLTMANQRRKAAEAADQLRDTLEEILETPASEDDELKAKKHAASALEGIEHAENALRLWRDHEEEAIDLLDEEPLDAADADEDAREEVKQARKHVEAAASLLDDAGDSSE